MRQKESINCRITQSMLTTILIDGGSSSSYNETIIGGPKRLKGETYQIFIICLELIF